MGVGSLDCGRGLWTWRAGLRAWEIALWAWGVGLLVIMEARKIRVGVDV